MRNATTRLNVEYEFQDDDAFATVTVPFQYSYVEERSPRPSSHNGLLKCGSILRSVVHFLTEYAGSPNLQEPNYTSCDSRLGPGPHALSEGGSLGGRSQFAHCTDAARAQTAADSRKALATPSDAQGQSVRLCRSTGRGAVGRLEKGLCGTSG